MHSLNSLRAPSSSSVGARRMSTCTRAARLRRGCGGEGGETGGGMPGDSLATSRSHVPGRAHPPLAPPGTHPQRPPPRAATLRIASAGVAGSENALRGRVGEVRRPRHRVLHDSQHVRRLRPRRPPGGGAGGAGGGGRSTRLATAWRCWVWLCLPCSGSDLRSDSGLRPHWRPRRVADPKNRPSRRPGEKHCSSFYTSCTNVEFVQDQGLLSVSCEGRRHSSTLVLDGDAVLTEFLI